MVTSFSSSTKSSPEKATQHQAVLTGFFLGGVTAELAVMHSAADRRGMTMYEFDGVAWAPALEATVRPEVLFVDVANIGGRDRLVTYESGRLNWFDPDSGTERPLVEVAAPYSSAGDLQGSATRPGGDPPHVDITRDLNHDGRDDLVLPDFDGFWISIQMSDGSFTDAVKLGPPEPLLDALVGNLDPGHEGAARTYRDMGLTTATIPVYLSRVHEMDYDRDGHGDLVFWNEDRFEVHRQDERGLFDPVPETFTAGVPFASEGAYSNAFDFVDRGVFSAIVGLGEKTGRTVLHSLHDLDGDGVTDLVTLTLSGRSITRQRSLYEVHFGKATPGGTVFETEAGARFLPRGKAGAMQSWGYSTQWLQDFNGDGRAEILFREINVGLGGMARAMIGNSVAIHLEFYCSEDGVYPDKPCTTRKIRRFAPFAGLGNVFLPPVQMGDIDGDGRSDLLVGHSPRQLHVYPGVPGPELLARQPRSVAVDLPPDERNTWLVDLNRDGKQDVLIHHTPTGHAPDAPHRVSTLIAR